MGRPRSAFKRNLDCHCGDPAFVSLGHPLEREDGIAVQPCTKVFGKSSELAWQTFEEVAVFIRHLVGRSHSMSTRPFRDCRRRRLWPNPEVECATCAYLVMFVHGSEHALAPLLTHVGALRCSVPSLDVLEIAAAVSRVPMLDQHLNDGSALGVDLFAAAS